MLRIYPENWYRYINYQIARARGSKKYLLVTTEPLMSLHIIFLTNALLSAHFRPIPVTTNDPASRELHLIQIKKEPKDKISS